VTLQTLLAFHLSKAQLALRVGCSQSTISRELRRNAGVGGRYDAVGAQHKYLRRREACRPAKILADAQLCGYVEEKLKEEWAPEQIARRLVVDFPDAPAMRVSHETVYQHVYADKRRGGTLHRALRLHRKKRRKRSNAKGRRGLIKDRVSIHDRPAVVETQSRIGDWEGDTIIGANHRGAAATFVDRKSLYTLAILMPDKTAASLNAAAITAFQTVPIELRHTLTTDNGKEFAAHKELQRALQIDIYFADPYKACQRAINENTNGLLRQYIPKKTDFRILTQEKLNHATQRLNNRPRKKLNYRTPHEVFTGGGVALRL
jgi:IS30 family transposase